MHRHLLAGFLIALLPSLCFAMDSWKEALVKRQATIDISWFTSNPFIFKNGNGELSGIEVEIMSAFKDYLSEKHQIDLTFNWIEASSFSGIMDEVRNARNLNLIGVSAFSITEERKAFLRFTDPYLPDISVLVSSKEVPIFDSYKELIATIEGMTAVTIKATNYERLLTQFRQSTDTNFDTKYISSDQNVLENIAKDSDRFGFIDLPIYLMFLRNGGSLTRQNFFTERGTGYGFVMPLQSDWHTPLNAFLSDKAYQQEIAKVISKYIGPELYGFIENLYNQDQLGTSILTKEKEIQLELIRNTNIQLQSEKKTRTILIFGIGISIFLLVVIGVLFYNNQKVTELLVRQKTRIEFQQKDIQKKNEQLINRNAKLISLNEDKNSMVRILAHDLRSPLNQIIGLAKALPGQLSAKKLDEKFIDLIVDGAQQINQMINKILDMDVLEGKQGLVLKETVKANDIVKAVGIRFEQAARQKEIALKCTNSKKLELETDHMLLFLILENLVSNAIKFAPSNTEVTISVDAEKNSVIFRVDDQGPGFTEEDKKLAFKRFQKLSAKPTGNEASTGLGLSIVKKYVKDLGGKVWLESEAGKGSSFFVSLPA